MPSTGQLFTDAERERVLEQARALNGSGELFSMVRAHVNPTHQRQIDSYLRGRVCNPFYLASSVRHLFAHGLLTPNPSGVPMSAVATVSRFLSRILFRTMDREFERRMIEFEKVLAHE